MLFSSLKMCADWEKDCCLMIVLLPLFSTPVNIVSESTEILRIMQLLASWSEAVLAVLAGLGSHSVSHCKHRGAQMGSATPGGGTYTRYQTYFSIQYSQILNLRLCRQAEVAHNEFYCYCLCHMPLCDAHAFWQTCFF